MQFFIPQDPTHIPRSLWRTVAPGKMSPLVSPLSQALPGHSYHSFYSSITEVQTNYLPFSLSCLEVLLLQFYLEGSASNLHLTETFSPFRYQPISPVLWENFPSHSDMQLPFHPTSFSSPHFPHLTIFFLYHCLKWFLSVNLDMVCLSSITK